MPWCSGILKGLWFFVSESWWGRRLHHQPTGSIDSLRIIKEIQFENANFELGMEVTKVNYVPNEKTIAVVFNP